MRNDELFSPNCPDEHAKRLVMGYALRGLVDSIGCYSAEGLVNAQFRVYKEWLAAVRASKPGFSCGFYEWLARDADAAFIFRPGDLVKYDGRYCVVADRLTGGMGWVNKWRITGAVPAREEWPQTLAALDVREADGRTRCLNGLDNGLKPADIPPEVFALACGRAKDCPMMNGGAE